MPDKCYTEDEARALLIGELARWTVDGGHLCRHYRTGGWKASLLLANAIGHLAEAAWHHPDLTVTYVGVAVHLVTHSAAGITDKDFELARLIEACVGWRPPAGSALPGTPDDPRTRYLRYD